MSLPVRDRSIPVSDVVEDGIGGDVERPDARLKVRGDFAYASDLWAEGMLWGTRLCSPHPYARIRSIDVSLAEQLEGVAAVLTHRDVPGTNAYGLEFQDQPALAEDLVRFQGEPVAIVAADHPDTARRAAAAIIVDYELLHPVTTAEEALEPDAPRLHPGGNALRTLTIRHGDLDAAQARADVVVSGTYEVGMQDQAFLGPEAGLAIPAADGGIELFVATQWLHLDALQLAACLGLPEEKVRLTLAGVGGAFGGREDLSIHVHASMLALETGRPVKMSYSREESFLGGHVHRHPARMVYEHGATHDGELVFVRARILLDGGAYASTSGAVCMTAAVVGAGPYTVPAAVLESTVAYTNNPPCGAMRGFGSVQACFGFESQMDKLADVLGLDRLEFRLRNAMSQGTTLPTGQVMTGPAPIVELLGRLRALPLPDESADSQVDARVLPGGLGNVTRGDGIKRGVGYAVGYKNIGFPAGFPDLSTARLRLWVSDGELVAEVHTAAAEVGQGVVTVQAQIVRTELGIERIHVRNADTTIGNAGGSSASRQTWVTGGAVRAACELVKQRLVAEAAVSLGTAPELLRLDANGVHSQEGETVSLVDLLRDREIDETAEYRPLAEVTPLDENGQGKPFYAYGFAAERAVVDVDPDLGLVRVVEVATALDVGRVINPRAVEGQVAGGVAQGVGLAVMEDLRLEGGRVRNPSFTDYLIPTFLDMPAVRTEVLEGLHPDAPYGVLGIGEASMIATPAAVASAIRAATGRDVTRIPVRPDDLALPI